MSRKTNNYILVCQLCPVEIGVADHACKRVGKDADVHTTEATDGLGAQITVVHAGKMGELLAVRWIVQMIELRIGSDAQIDNTLV